MAAGGQNASLSEGRHVVPHPHPQVLSPESNRALVPYWTEQTASLPHSRGALQQLTPWRQGAVAEGEEKVSTKTGARSTSAEKMVASPLYNQKRQ